MGVHPGTWEARAFLLEEPVGDPGIKALAREECLSSQGANEQAKSGNRRTKATECRGSAWDSEHLIVPVKRGNLPEGTPWREGGCRVT
jgi:hypothetical protein